MGLSFRRWFLGALGCVLPPLTMIIFYDVPQSLSEFPDELGQGSFSPDTILASRPHVGERPSEDTHVKARRTALPSVREQWRDRESERE